MKKYLVVFAITVALAVLGGWAYRVFRPITALDQAVILKTLCRPSKETGVSCRKVRQSSVGNYYQLTYIGCPGDLGLSGASMIDGPGDRYYKMDGEFIDFCGGQIPSKNLFCTTILPMLSFRGKNLCDSL